MKNKIGWCTMTFNPCWGCNNHCEYCYARKIAKRFYKKISLLEFKSHFERHPDWVWTGDYLSGLRDFKPTFLFSQYCKKFPKKPQRIFVGSMSEIFYWNEEWIEMVIEKVKQYPQHIFQFLTKFPDIYLRYNFPKNCWLGITVTSAKNYNYYDSGCDDSSIHLAYQKFKISNPNNLKFICFEPLLNEISINLDFIDWVIVGSETGNRKGKIIPKKEWIENIVDYCKRDKIPVYLKDSLKNIYPVEIKEFPEVK